MKGKLKHIMFCMLIFISSLSFHAQKNDSRLPVLPPNFTSDSARINELSSVIENENDPATWKPLNDTLMKWCILQVSKKPGNTFFRYMYSNALNNSGMYMRLTGIVDSALMYYRQAEKEIKQARKPDQQAAVQNNIAYLYSKTGAYNEALDYYMKALNTFERLKKEKDIAMVKNNIGFVYYEENESDL